jgi:iron complex transport system substrate-binding protein
MGIEASAILSMQYESESLVVVDMAATANRPDALQYVFTTCANTTDAELAYPDANVFSVPISKLSASDTVQLALLFEVDKYELVSTFGSTTYVSNTEVKQFLEDPANNVVNHNSNGSASAYGLMRDAGVDAVLVGSYTWEFTSAEERLTEAGIADKHLLIDESRESTPLGRAEWIKLIGLLTGAESLAKERYNTIRDNYLLAKTFATAQTSPTVWAGSEPYAPRPAPCAAPSPASDTHSVARSRSAVSGCEIRCVLR